MVHESSRTTYLINTYLNYNANHRQPIIRQFYSTPSEGSSTIALIISLAKRNKTQNVNDQSSKSTRPHVSQAQWLNRLLIHQLRAERSTEHGYEHTAKPLGT